MTIEQELRDVIRDRGLRSIGVNIFDKETGDVTVYAHWDDHVQSVTSWTAPTFQEALDRAVARRASS